MSNPGASSVDSIRNQRSAVPMLQPLRHPRYRELWLANAVSNMGTGLQTFAAAWLIASTSASPLMATLVQTATWLPILVCAPLAGVLADAVDRPRLLLAVNAGMALAACIMGVLAMSGLASAWPVLLLTCAMGAGAAMVWPAWQASLASLVDADEIAAAASLNNLSVNTGASAGPALGGLLFRLVGAAPLFLANAVSFAGLLVLYWRWCAGSPRRATGKIDVWGAFKAGAGAAFGSRPFRAFLRLTVAIHFNVVAFAALLPVLVRDVQHGDARAYGSIMASYGAGAVTAAFVLPTLRARHDKRHLLVCAVLAFAVMLLALPFMPGWQACMALTTTGGVALGTIVSSLHASAQLAFPDAVRARTLSVYMMAMASAQAIGSLCWGALASRVGIASTLVTAGVAMLCAGLLLVGRRSTAHDLI